MHARSLAVGGALLIGLAVPAVAQAVPTMDPLKPCYVTATTAAGRQSEGFDVRAQGFTPNSQVQLAIDGQPVRGGEALQTDPTGALGQMVALPPVAAPFVEQGSRTFTVTLTELGNAGNVVTATAKSTALGVSVKPKSATPSSRIRFKGLGFTGPQPVYAHYVYKGRLRKTVRLTKRTRGCGSFKARRPQIPVAHPPTGDWLVQFDQSKRYVTAPGVFVRLTFRVTLKPR